MCHWGILMWWDSGVYNNEYYFKPISRLLQTQNKVRLWQIDGVPVFVSCWFTFLVLNIIAV